MQDSFTDEVKPFKAFHYNGLGIREEDGTKKVSDNVIKNVINYFSHNYLEWYKVELIMVWPLSLNIHDSHFGSKQFLALKFWWIVITTLSLDATVMVSKTCLTIGEHADIVFITQLVTLATVWPAKNTLDLSFKLSTFDKTQLLQSLKKIL